MHKIKLRQSFYGISWKCIETINKNCETFFRKVLNENEIYFIFSIYGLVPWKVDINETASKFASFTYSKRLLISACFSHAYTSLLYGVHASKKKHALISKRLRYFNFFFRSFLDSLLFLHYLCIISALSHLPYIFHDEIFIYFDINLFFFQIFEYNFTFGRLGLNKWAKFSTITS